jgi:hypothetical protein
MSRFFMRLELLRHHCECMAQKPCEINSFTQRIGAVFD